MVKKPATTNSKDRPENDQMPNDTSKQLLYDYKQTQSHNGHSNFYPSFLNAIEHYILE